MERGDEKSSPLSYGKADRIKGPAVNMNGNYWLLIVTNAMLVTDKIRTYSTTQQENKQNMTDENI